MLKSISLTSSMRSNLQSLKTIALQMGKTQNILSTGKKVNSAIDNASSYYQARSLTNRAADLNNLLDAMGQGIQTIQAATQGLTSATAFLEQALTVAKQALASDFEVENDTENNTEEIVRFAMRAINKTYQDYLDEGYQEINASMDVSEIQALFVKDAKIILKEDITLSQGLEINADNITIFGNGKTLTVNADDATAITVKGKGVVTDIKGLNIIANGTNAIGIKATESATITVDSLDNVNATGTGAAKFYYRNEELFNGKEYTQAIYNQLSTADSVSGTATEYAMRYYAIDAGDEDFGVGKWYIGAIGEWSELYGYDYADIVEGVYNGNGANGKTVNKINQTLNILNAKKLEVYRYWTSSEYEEKYQWTMSMGDGKRDANTKTIISCYVRCFNNMENCFNPVEQNGPQIGDIMYSDKTWSSAADYNANKAFGKTAVGVVFDVNTINGDVKIVALNETQSGLPIDKSKSNIINVPDYDSSKIKDLRNTGKIIVTYENTPPAKEEIPDIPEEDIGSDDVIGDDEEITKNDDLKLVQENYKKQYNQILKSLNEVIIDTSYQGVNLLKGANLTVTFNESRSNKFTVSGRDMSAESLGLSKVAWETKTDVESAIKELTSAIDKIRDFQSELGNNYSIIQTRQNFTEALTDVLETGADNLVLADMNEVSAEYLMLQTRQQLATNSLSLAAQSAQSILKLF